MSWVTALFSPDIVLRQNNEMANVGFKKKDN